MQNKLDKKTVRNENVGKRFEENFKKSISVNICYTDLKILRKHLRKVIFTFFTHKNPCDYFLFDGKRGIFYCLELKTTKDKYMTFEKIELDDTQPRKMIHKHQILSLQEYSIYKNVYPCFVFNFRSEDIGIERTYMQYIGDFMKMYHGLNKSSFNEIDLISNNAVKIKGNKKRVNYYWNLTEFLKQIEF